MQISSKRKTSVPAGRPAYRSLEGWALGTLIEQHAVSANANITGIDVTRQVRMIRAGDLHAGNDDAAVRKAAVASGCIAFLTKLFSMVALIKPPKKASAAYSWARR
jgi:hypothetical protein